MKSRRCEWVSDRMACRSPGQLIGGGEGTVEADGSGRTADWVVVVPCGVGWWCVGTHGLGLGLVFGGCCRARRDRDRLMIRGRDAPEGSQCFA